jgi:hypothetical protein
LIVTTGSTSLASFDGHGFTDDELAANRAFIIAEYLTWKQECLAVIDAALRAEDRPH